MLVRDGPSGRVADGVSARVTRLLCPGSSEVMSCVETNDSHGAPPGKITCRSPLACAPTLATLNEINFCPPRTIAVCRRGKEVTRTGPDVATGTVAVKA